MANYQVIGEDRKVEGKYKPEYHKLYENARDDEEREYIREVSRRDIYFTFNIVVIVKNRCGHYEILQLPTIDSIEGLDGSGTCTRCVLGSIEKRLKVAEGERYERRYERSSL